ncbi:MAG: methyltransferase domain-containing protein [Acidobacteriia bacterium]|nr:methyltransferase domain-containing protein [Terriglobia bacterium]
MRPVAERSGGLRSLLGRFVGREIESRIADNFRDLDPAGVERITASLKESYFSRSYLAERQADSLDAYLASDAGGSDLRDHLSRRLEGFRTTVVPWLDHAKPLSGSTVLEIGCGTGSSTVALAEQGAKVTAVDVAEESLAVARDRCRVYGLDVELLECNATEVGGRLSDRRFDFVILFACLEHMTHGERMIAMTDTWGMLSPGALWCVVETPNRLWFFDHHTSLLPFYPWLPDDLALLYSRFSPRPSFRGSYPECTGDAMQRFLRRGRGVSYHEFDLTLKRAEELRVISSLPLYLRGRSLRREVAWRRSLDHRFESFLARVGPAIHRGFYQPSLDLIIVKE